MSAPGAARPGRRIAHGIAIAVLLGLQLWAGQALPAGAPRSGLLIALLGLECAAALAAEARPRGWAWLVAALAVFAPYFVVIFSDARWRFR